MIVMLGIFPAINPKTSNGWNKILPVTNFIIVYHGGGRIVVSFSHEMVVVLLSLFHVDILNSIGNGLKQVFQLDNFFFFFSLYVFLFSF